MEKEHDEKRFEEYARFLAGESDLSRNSGMWERIARDQEEKRLLKRLSDLWNNYFPAVNSAEDIWSKTSAKIGFEANLVSAPKRSIVFLLKYAAAAALIISLGTNIYQYLGRMHQSGLDLVEYTTRQGEVREIDLADGTHIWLNSRSTLWMPSAFTGKERKVYLSGEAYFNVAKNPEKPFIVNASVFDVKVLGTSFSVKNYQNEPAVMASLVEGKIELENNVKPGEKIVLKPSDEAVFSRTDSTIHVVHSETQFVGLWRNGRFRFYNEELSSVVRQLERKYDCEFIFLDEDVEKLRFTGDFDNVELDAVLGMLNKAQHFYVEKVGKKYLLSINSKKNTKDKSK